MVKAIIFGGTTEGRELCEVCAKHGITAVYCAATDDGARPVAHLGGIDIRVGRLDAARIETLIKSECPELVVDATHPYAAEAGANIALACKNAGARRLRVTRGRGDTSGCIEFNSMTELTVWLGKEPGNIFVTTGSSLAAAFTKIEGYQSRMWLRILPNPDGLRACLSLGYPPGRIICMQGPFSQSLNRAMFEAADARVLVTKESGDAGGFMEKRLAAQSLGMRVAVLTPPTEEGGAPINEAAGRILELLSC